MENGIKMVIGSYGSYAAANNKALGSKWLDLADFSDWSDVLDELTAEGFGLAGEDAELGAAGRRGGRKPRTRL